MQGLVPGDLNAVDWAQGAHENLLFSRGAYAPHTRILNGAPFPRGPHAEALVLDELSRGGQPRLGECPLPWRLRLFARARRIRKWGWVNIPASRSGGFFTPLLWGRRSWAARGGQELRDPLVLRSLSSQLSLIAASSGVVTGAFLRRLLSGWIHCLVARRVLLRFIGAAFRALPDLENDNRVFLLTSKVRSEILLLALMAPAMTTNLRAQRSDCLVATDASEHGLGACTSSLDPALHAEFWRHRGQRGAYVHMVGWPRC